MEKDLSESIQEIVDDKEDFYTNDDLFEIKSWGADLSFRELITMYKEEELLKPELQRNYVWDKIEASRFIDSLLLGLPVPSIFLASTKDETKLIIDGYQRIMTVHDFVEGIFNKDKSVFKLSNSEKINKRWRNKSFKELDDKSQRKIKSTTIHAIYFEQNSPKDDNTSLYQIFERINTSGKTLMSQEIRNCVYQGPFNTLLFELNKCEKWRALFGSIDQDNRMRDMEFILRFFALKEIFKTEKKTGQISLKNYLNTFMGKKESNLPETIEARRKEFLTTIDFIYDKIGLSAFKNISVFDAGKVINKFHPTIFDSLSIAVSLLLDENSHYLPKGNLEEKRQQLLMNQDYVSYISSRTTNLENIHGRIKFCLDALRA
ncbi:MAG: hypothetical protein CVV21_11480 [Candidatus Goldiibacteriota bacterium HGW-Goldbacteria-1]|jgi:uncharacterized protein with ParB-like and HNH nuclease domain|nr:MAG: hypothetical protein CVV21_11480 [Candidatus Goldiibacteriota bacterium HGW-Goldbacteria-1]